MIELTDLVVEPEKQRSDLLFVSEISKVPLQRNRHFATA